MNNGERTASTNKEENGNKESSDKVRERLRVVAGQEIELSKEEKHTVPNIEAFWESKLKSTQATKVEPEICVAADPIIGPSPGPSPVPGSSPSPTEKSDEESMMPQGQPALATEAISDNDNASSSCATSDAWSTGSSSSSCFSSYGSSYDSSQETGQQSNSSRLNAVELIAGIENRSVKGNKAVVCMWSSALPKPKTQITSLSGDPAKNSATLAYPAYLRSKMFPNIGKSASKQDPVGKQPSSLRILQLAKPEQKIDLEKQDGSQNKKTARKPRKSLRCVFVAMLLLAIIAAVILFVFREKLFFSDDQEMNSTTSSNNDASSSAARDQVLTPKQQHSSSPTATPVSLGTVSLGTVANTNSSSSISPPAAETFQPPSVAPVTIPPSTNEAFEVRQSVASTVSQALLEVLPSSVDALDDPNSYQSQALRWVQDYSVIFQNIDETRTNTVEELEEEIDEEDNGGQQYAIPYFRYVPFSEVDDVDAASLLGYTETSWNLLGTATIEETRFSDLNSAEQEAAVQLGFNEESWDCDQNHYSAYNWYELVESNLAEYFIELGWNRNSWQLGDSPPAAMNLYWNELSQAQQAAAMEVCYSRAVWDGISIDTWVQTSTEQATINQETNEQATTDEQTTANSDYDYDYYYSNNVVTTARSSYSYGRRHRHLQDSNRVLQQYALACIFISTNAVRTPATDLVYGDDPSGNTVYNVPGWANQEGWLDMSEQGECTWDGVECDTAGRITTLDLSSNQLTGYFPDEVVLLRDSIETLNLSNNSISNEGEQGHAWLGALTQLRALFIQDTLLANDGIPTVVGSLTNLVDFDCSYTRYNGPLRAELFENLSQLRYLSIGGNSYNSAIPTNLPIFLPNLQYFYAPSSDLIGDLDFLIGMDELVGLWIDDNPGFAGSALPPQLGSSETKFILLSAVGCGLTGSIPSSIGGMTDLENLFLQNNQLTGIVPATLSELANLESLELQGNDLTGSMPASVCALRQDGSLATLAADCDSEISCELDCCTCCGSSC